MKKITRSTVKAFIRYARHNLYIKNKSSFDGMTDACEPVQDNDWKKAEVLAMNEWDNIHTLGVKDAYFVGPHGSKDYFYPIITYDFIGYEVSNCCGNFLLGIKKDKLWLIPGQDKLKQLAESN